MTGFVIQRADGAYVAPLGTAHSYTRRLHDARVFPTRAAADGERCPETERVVPLDTAFSLSLIYR